jgi:hypothetical protein
VALRTLADQLTKAVLLTFRRDTIDTPGERLFNCLPTGTAAIAEVLVDGIFVEQKTAKLLLPPVTAPNRCLPRAPEEVASVG